MGIRIHDMIRRDIVTRITRDTRKTNSLAVVGNEVAAGAERVAPPAPSIERLESYASLRRQVKKYETLTTILIGIVMTLAVLAFAFWNMAVEARDAYLIHDYQEHYEDAHDDYPPLTWDTWNNVVNANQRR